MLEKMGIILITGSNRGIGFEFARQYAKRGKGVLATCRSPNEAERLAALGSDYPKLTLAQLDLSSEKSIENLIRKLKGEKTELDLLLSNAGVFVKEPFSNWSQKSFRKTLDVNLIGPALLAQSLDSFLSRSAKVVHLSSGLGSLERGGEGMSDGDSYAMSKAALNMLTVRLASVYRGSKRTVVSMSPGWVATDMGGAGAALQVDESVSNMIQTIEALTEVDSGRFIDNQGNTLPW